MKILPKFIKSNKFLAIFKSSNDIKTAKLEKEAKSAVQGLHLNSGQPLADTFEGKSLLPVLVEKPKHSDFIKMTEEENNALPAELRNTVLGKKFAETASEIRHKNFEVATYNLHQTGDEIARTETNETYICNFSTESTKKIKTNLNLKLKLAMIHNHPYKSTFSNLDLPHLNYGDSLIATMPDGGYAFLQKQENSLPIPNEIIDNYENLVIDLTQKLVKMKTDNDDITKILDKVQHKNLKEIADRYNIRYEYKKGNLAKKDVIDAGYTNELEENYKSIDNYSLSDIMKRNIFPDEPKLK